MKLTMTTGVLCLLVAGSVMAKDCSPSDAEAADLAVDHLNNWHEVYENVNQYSQCDDGSIAEGNSEAVIRLLVDKWNTLPELNTLVKKKPAFGEWVLNHVDSTLDSDDLQKAAHLATSQCPTTATMLCQQIVRAATQAAEDN